MYNLSRRLAMFKALRERTEFQSYIPIYRTFYGTPARPLCDPWCDPDMYKRKYMSLKKQHVRKKSIYYYRFEQR